MTSRLLSLCFALLLPVIAPAQSFAPAITVNGDAITEYELEQRFLLDQVLLVPGASLQSAADALIDDRLKMQAATSAGVEVTQDAVEAAFEEFAQRANLSSLEFLEMISQEGVDPQTFRDRIEAELAWRDFARGAFGPRSAVSEAELDRALALSATQTGARILLAEIRLPTTSDASQAASYSLAEQIQQEVRNSTDFAEAARRFSIAESRANGGLVGWINLSELPPIIASALLTLAPGEVTDPFQVNPAELVLFQARGLEERRAQAPGAVSIEYATLALPADPTAAASTAGDISAQVDTCDDLYPIARELPPGALVRETRATGSLSREIASAVSNLDANESTVITTSNGPRLLMLCARVGAIVEDVGVEEVRNQLRGQRLTSYAESYLEELRADAKIVR